MNYQKVRDHCHHIGKYRGAAHNICKLNLKCLMKYPLFSIMAENMTIISSLKNW